VVDPNVKPPVGFDLSASPVPNPLAEAPKAEDAATLKVNPSAVFCVGDTVEEGIAGFLLLPSRTSSSLDLRLVEIDFESAEAEADVEVVPKVNPPVGFKESEAVLGGAATPNVKPLDTGAGALDGTGALEDCAETPKLKPDELVDAFFGDSTPNLKPLVEGATTSVFFGSTVDTPNVKPLEAVETGADELGSLGLTFPVGALPGLLVSQQGHLAYLAPFVTAQLGHFQLPGSICMNRASGFAPAGVLDIDAGATDIAEPAEEDSDNGFAVSQQGHFERLAAFITAQVEHLQLPASTCMKRASGLVALDGAAALAEETGAATFSGDFSLRGTDFVNDSGRTRGDEGIKENGVVVDVDFAVNAF